MLKVCDEYCMVVYDNVFYVFGSIQIENGQLVEQYNVYINFWIVVVNMFQMCCVVIVVMCGDYIFIIGGRILNGGGFIK